VPITVCWSVKGGSGTSVVAAALALAAPVETTLVDLDGDSPAVLGVPEPTGQGIADWLSSDAPARALADLVVEIDSTTVLVPRGRNPVDPRSSRWVELIDWLGTRPHAVVDAGTGDPPDGLLSPGVRSLLVTRGCYLALRRTTRVARRPDGVVLLTEPGRSLGRREVGRAVGAPVVATVSVDPAVARAVDAGLLAARLPRLLHRELGRLGLRPARRRSPVVRALPTAAPR
jgi:hypothetical protein